MKSDLLKLVSVFALIAVFSLSACGSIQQMVQGTPTSTPTNTSTPSLTPTLTATPTLTSTPTPNAEATEFASRENLMSSEIQKYVDLGYLPYSTGSYSELPDFEEELAQIDNYQWWPFDLTPATFVLRAHFKWSSAVENTNLSGCGFVFMGRNDEALAVFLDRKSVVLLGFSGNKWGRSGGSGAVNFNHSDEADFTLIVNSELEKIFVLVNDVFNVEYGYPSVKNLGGFRGYVGYALISGAYTDYGTRCVITDAKLWTID